MLGVGFDGVVEVTGDLELARVVLASQYYLLSSLPSQHSARPLPPFCGLSPGSLAYGLLGQDYQGHNFWDTETWMYPAVLVLHPTLARELLQSLLQLQPALPDASHGAGDAGSVRLGDSVHLLPAALPTLLQ